MKTDELIAKMRKLDIKLPQGTGKDGRVLNRDLEKAIADHHLSHTQSTFGRRFRNSIESPMLAKRVKDPMPLMMDPNYVAEPKLNGVRMICTIDADFNVEFFGRNISDVTCVPMEYTGKIAVGGEPFSHYERLGGATVIDMEVTADGLVELVGGGWAKTPLESVMSILSRSPEESIVAQQDVPLTCNVFDILCSNGDNMMNEPYSQRRQYLLRMEDYLPIPVVPTFTDCYGTFRRIVDDGGEGIVLKHVGGRYTPSSSRSLAWVKVKRTIGDAPINDVDAFVIDVFATPEYPEGGPVGGVMFGAYLEDGTVHHIASVTAIPDYLRKEFEMNPPIGEVYRVEGMDISSRHLRIVHARVNWYEGARKDKSASQCIVNIKDLQPSMF